MTGNQTGHARVNRVRLRSKWAWMSYRNWRKGLRWDAVARCRCCDHTTPAHYRTCRNHVRARRLAVGSYVELGGQYVDLPTEDDR